MTETEKKDLLYTINCLDKGFVRLVDFMGDDSRIVEAARISYSSGKKKLDDDRLIARLYKDMHTSPFEQVELVFHIKLPIFVARQMIRHRTANVNEISGRYSVLKTEFYVPDASVIKKQSVTNKQGRSEEGFTDEEVKQILSDMQAEQKQAGIAYNKRIEIGMSRELARINLPVSTYTEWYWKLDLHNLLHFITLRNDPHAQYEIRVYASAILEFVSKVAPVSYAAFMKFKRVTIEQ